MNYKKKTPKDILEQNPNLKEEVQTSSSLNKRKYIDDWDWDDDDDDDDDDD